MSFNAGRGLMASEFNDGVHTPLISFAGQAIIASASFTRPADTMAYAVGDLVANSTTPGAVVALQLPVARLPGSTGMIMRCRLSTSKTGLAGSKQFRVHFFRNDPGLNSGIANGDNGAFSVKGIAALHIGQIDITLDRVFLDGAQGVGAPSAGPGLVFQAATGSSVIYALIEARSAYVPSAGETFTVACETLRD